MRRGIIPHATHVDETNIDEFATRRSFFSRSTADRPNGSSSKSSKSLACRSSTQAWASTRWEPRSEESSGQPPARGPPRRIWDGGLISFADAEADEYEQNIPIADLNMLNATLAVIRWKKLFGFYSDLDHEFSSMYTIDGNHLLNEDQAA